MIYLGYDTRNVLRVTVRITALKNKNTQYLHRLRVCTSERLCQICDQVRLVLHTDRKAHEVVGETQLESSRFWYGRVRHDGRALYQRLDRTQGLGQREQTHAFQKHPGHFKVPLDVERDH